jgi:hypothetical protein
MIIIEGKLEDLSKKYIPQFNRDAFTEGLTPESVIEHLYVSDPSPTKKYFEWMIKECLGLIKNNYIINNEKVARIVMDIIEFDRNIDKLSEDFLEYNEEEIGEITYKFLKDKPLKDINTYNFDILRKIIPTLIKHKTESQRRVLAKEGAKLVYQNDKYKVYEIDTYDASCFYGSGSKWCTTNKSSDNHFRSYGTGDKKLLYVISKTKTKETDPRFYKIAINVRYGEEYITFWDAPDDSFNGWNYFRGQDPNILTFLIDYIKEKSPENYFKMIPDEYIYILKQESEGLSDIEMMLLIDIHRNSRWLSYKYNTSMEKAFIKKLDLLQGNVNGYFGDYFSDDEKRYFLNNIDDILTPRGLTWKDFYKTYHEMAISLDNYPPSVFIDKFLDGDKNKLLVGGRNDLTIAYWVAKGGNALRDLGVVYGAERLLKYFIKNKINSGYGLTRLLGGTLSNETPKKRRELYEIVYKYEKGWDISDLPEYLFRNLPRETFIASFNNSDDREIEPDSYRRAFLYLKNNSPNLISDVFGVEDIVKIFKTEEKSFTYFLKNYDEFSGNDLNISNLTEMFVVEVPDSIFGRYMSTWEKTRVITKYKTKEGAKKLFDFVLKKFSFKKLADIVGYDEVFQLFSIVGFKKGINYMIENKIGDIRIDDIKIVNGEPILMVVNREDYAFLFKDNNMANSILSGEMDWEPYSDVVYNWINQVWDCVEPKSMEVIKAWIKENIVDYENFLGETIEVNDTYLNEISDDELGDIIDDNGYFEDLKNEMTWAYEQGYNNGVRNKLYENVTDQLETYLGKYIGYEPYIIKKKFYNKEKGGIDSKEETEYRYLFKVGGDFYETLYNYSLSNWGYPVDYNTYFSTLLSDLDLDKLYIETEVYPDDKEVCEYFNEDLPGRI